VPFNGVTMTLPSSQATTKDIPSERFEKAEVVPELEPPNIKPPRKATVKIATRIRPQTMLTSPSKKAEVQYLVVDSLIPFL
jgi:hypothetical protein